MTREQAKRKYEGLRRMTTARGCTSHESATAIRLAAALAKRWGFDMPPSATEFRPDFESRFKRAEQHAAMRFRWEYRRCGKPRCRCAGAQGDRHGPYRYGKKREGRKVRSVYIGL